MEQGHKDRTLAWLEQRVRNFLRTAKINKNLTDVDAQRLHLLKSPKTPRGRQEAAVPALATTLAPGAPSGGRGDRAGGRGAGKEGKGKKGRGKGKKDTKGSPNPAKDGASPKEVTSKTIENYDQLPPHLKDQCAAFQVGKCSRTAEECLAATKRKRDRNLPRKDKAVLIAAYKAEARRKEERSQSRQPKDTKGSAGGKGAASREGTPQRRNDGYYGRRYACANYMNNLKCDVPKCKFLHVTKEEAIRSGLMPPSPKASGKANNTAAAATVNEQPAAPAIVWGGHDDDSDEDAESAEGNPASSSAPTGMQTAVVTSKTSPRGETPADEAPVTEMMRVPTLRAQGADGTWRTMVPSGHRSPRCMDDGTRRVGSRDNSGIAAGFRR